MRLEVSGFRTEARCSYTSAGGAQLERSPSSDDEIRWRKEEMRSGFVMTSAPRTFCCLATFLIRRQTS